MSILIKGMEMPTTGLYFVGVDNAGGRDKTVVTVERMLGNRDVRQIVGSFELVPVPPHGRLIAEGDAIETAWMILAGLGYRRKDNQQLEQTVREVFATAPAIEVE